MIPKDILKEYDKSIILSGYRGSIAHGLYIPNKNENSTDDKDVMMIVIPEIDCYFGLKEFGSRGTKEVKRDEWDIVIYEIKKFISLLRKCNPNVLSLLWLEPELYIKITEIGQRLIDNRNLFVSKAVYHSFVGYSYYQLHRMTHMEFKGYMGEKRKKLVEKYGYDCKNASHLIRLLKMGIEFLNEGELHILREDAQQLLEIKNGKWSLEQVKQLSDDLFKKIENAYDNSTLPNKCDYDKINRLCIGLIVDYHY